MSTGRMRLDGRLWSMTAAAVLGVAVTASLGRWQMSRAAQKEALQAAMEARAAEPVLDLRAAQAAAEAGRITSQGETPELLHRRVFVRGTWLVDRTVWLDNRQMQGHPGFYVITPLRLESGGVMLVQRGWAPRNFEDRTQLPQVVTPAGPVEVLGRLSPPPARLYDMGAAEHDSIRQNLDLGAFRVETGLPLAGLSIQQNDVTPGQASNDGLLRDWPQPDSGVSRHHGYAFQWFGLCALMIFLYVWFQILPRIFPQFRSGRRAKPGA